MSAGAHGDGGAAAAARRAAAAVIDPELRVVTIEELGILRDVEVDAGTGEVVVTITPTYVGCPAMDTIRAEIRRAVRAAGFPQVQVRTTLRPAWSTDLISESGLAKLAAAGIAPPRDAASAVREAAPSAVRDQAPVRSGIPLRLTVRCPRCGSPQTEELSRFGSTACKALWRCTACTEPFEHVKAW